MPLSLHLLQGVYSDPKCKTGRNHMDHAVLLVGYGTDDVTGEDYWLVKKYGRPESGLVVTWFVSRLACVCPNCHVFHDTHSHTHTHMLLCPRLSCPVLLAGWLQLLVQVLGRRRVRDPAALHRVVGVMQMK